MFNLQSERAKGKEKKINYLLLNLDFMGFNENTVFPVFVFNKDTEDYYMYLSKFVCILFYNGKRELDLQVDLKGYELQISSSEIEISKDDFLKEHSDLLLKTDLTKYFL